MFFRSCDFILNFFELFTKMRQRIAAIQAFMKFCVAQDLLVELHIDDVLEVLLLVGLQIIDNYHRKIPLYKDLFDFQIVD